MIVTFDIETDALYNYTVAHVIVCKDIETERLHIFRGPKDYDKFLKFADGVTLWIGHNVIMFDFPALKRLLGFEVDHSKVVDTLVLSRMYDYRLDNKGHSLDAWGERLQFPKLVFKEFSKYSKEMEEYCIRDVEVTEKLYKFFWEKMFKNKLYSNESIINEHKMSFLCREMHDNGIHFDIEAALELHKEISDGVDRLKSGLQDDFPPIPIVTEVRTPKYKKDGNLSRVGLKWYDGTLDHFTGGSYCLLTYQEFNPGSPRQVIDRISKYGWRPKDKTDGHNKNKDKDKVDYFKKYGWKINETNLATLSDKAPAGAKNLVKFIMLSSRLSTLNEWFNAYNPETGRVHGEFNSIGTWTHRSSHKKPNMGNIAAEKSIKYTGEELSQLVMDYGKRMRSLWCAPKGKKLLGVDADGMQLRILAHYVDDPKYTEEIVDGDVHTANQLALGKDICKTRDNAKTFIYAFLLGAGIGKIAEILDTVTSTATQAKENFLNANPGLLRLKNSIIKRDTDLGYFIGLDGRLVKNASEHLMLAGYLQNAEAVIVKLWAIRIVEKIRSEGLSARLVNFVHDELLFEVDSEEDATKLGKITQETIEEVGEELGFKCPLACSPSMGDSWYDVH